MSHGIRLEGCGLLRDRLRSGRNLASIEGGGEVLCQERIVEKIPKVGVHDIFLRVSVVAEENGIKLTAVLLG